MGLGEYDLSQPNPARVQTFDVTDILVNERFNPDAYTDDIAILYLADEAQFTDYVWPICLPPPDMDLSGQLAVVIGKQGGGGFACRPQPWCPYMAWVADRPCPSRPRL